MEELPLDSAEVKKAQKELHKKQKEVGKKGSGKTKDKKEKTPANPCKAPEILVDSQDGSVLKVCSNSNVSEWKSLALLGKLALSDAGNKYRADYSQLFQTEPELGLKLFSELHKGE